MARIAWPLRDQGVPLPDLIQEGNIGLMEAVDRWDYRRGCRFSAYAVWWIRSAIAQAIDDSSLIRLPAYVQEDYRKVLRAAAGLESTSDAWPTVDEIAEALSVSPDWVTFLLAKVPSVSSLESLPCWTGDAALGTLATRHPWLLDCPMRHDARKRSSLASADDDCALPPCLDAAPATPASNVPYCFDDYWQGIWPGDEPPAVIEFRQNLAFLLHSVSSPHRRILSLTYPLDDGQPPTIDEISARFGVPREHIRQIQLKATAALRYVSRRPTHRHRSG